jgi:hypothetical protein
MVAEENYIQKVQTKHLLAQYGSHCPAPCKAPRTLRELESDILSLERDHKEE